jgi:hypothetical protein
MRPKRLAALFLGVVFTLSVAGAAFAGNPAPLPPKPQPPKCHPASTPGCS